MGRGGIQFLFCTECSLARGVVWGGDGVGEIYVDVNLSATSAQLLAAADAGRVLCCRAEGEGLG